MRFATLGVLFGLLCTAVAAQTPLAHPLSDYAGTYAYSPGTTIEIVAGDELFAVLDGAKYKLRPAGIDNFLNPGGASLPFRRDGNCKITGFEESGQFRPRISSAVTPESAALGRPRPPGQESPQDYRYLPPPELHDGIPVGDIAKSDLGTDTANVIVHAILDGTYKDVHSVLLFQRGKLVLEEYFYGYSAARPHQLRSATKSVVGIVAGIAVDQGALSGAIDTALEDSPRSDIPAPPDSGKAYDRAWDLGDATAQLANTAFNAAVKDGRAAEALAKKFPGLIARL